LEAFEAQELDKERLTWETDIVVAVVIEPDLDFET
jgi:hypothetical protein